jgi:hypothetical protein
MHEAGAGPGLVNGYLPPERRLAEASHPVSVPLHPTVTVAVIVPVTCPLSPPGCQLIHQSHAGQDTTLLVHTPGQVRPGPWRVSRPSLEDVVLAYMARSVELPRHRR